ncbi:MAG: hypothetical protein QOH84_5912, partial [Kribbellaceae bacterium]|nr:hypothetical protein [Kribbellaceae bacterium]
SYADRVLVLADGRIKTDTGVQA